MPPENERRLGEEASNDESGAGQHTDKQSVPHGPLEVHIDSIPQELREQLIWVAWKLVPNHADPAGKRRKLPIDPKSGLAAKINDPSTWSTFEQALQRMQVDRLSGISFAITADGPYTGIDLDSCRNPVTAEVETWAWQIVETLQTYTEVSPSGTGLHLIVRCKLPKGGRKKGRVEMYDAARFLTVTGHLVPGTVGRIEHRADQISLLHAEVFGIQVEEDAPDRKHSPRTDEEILTKASRARNHRKFDALWAGDFSAYPSQSEADIALCVILAYWARGDRDQVDRLFQRSGLMRAKWNEVHGDSTYGERTLSTALQMHDASETQDGEDGNPKISIATRLIELAAEAKIELFHDRDNIAYAVIPVDKHWENVRLSDRNFELWLRRIYFAKEKSAPNASALSDAIAQLEAMATFDGAEHEVFVRVGGTADKIYVDLGSRDWTVIEITADGWRVMHDCPVRFRRPRGVAPLPVPTHGGSIDDLREFINVCDADWPLVLAWLVAAFLPKGPFIVLEFLGEQGSAKSTSARVLRMVVDPNTADLRCEPREVRDLLISAANSWITAFDNLSSLPVWLSDALCRLATGGGLATRLLYSDDEERLFNFQRPVVITGIEDVILKPDLLDRAILCYLPPLPDRERRTEQEFWARFESLLPGILGALLTAVAGGLRNRAHIKLDNPPRMADFATWAVACEAPLGLAPNTILAAYRKNREAAVELSLEASVVAQAVIGYMTNWPAGIEGTATEVLTALQERLASKPPQGWPKGPQPFAGKLRRVAPNLRAIGIDVRFGREGKRRYISIHWQEGSGRSTEPSDAARRGMTGEAGAEPCAQTPVDHGLTHANDANDGNDAVSPTSPVASEGDQEPCPEREAGPSDEGDSCVQTPHGRNAENASFASSASQTGPTASPEPMCGDASAPTAPSLAASAASEWTAPSWLDPSEIPSAPNTQRPPCYSCGCEVWWVSIDPDVGAVCPACAPPASAGVVAQWIRSRPREAKHA
jgi:hypothetical protein